MAIPLRVLIIEDSPADAELMVLQLTKGGFQPEWQRVETEPDYLAALGTNPDLILADFRLPNFSALRALQLMKERSLDIPFIVVSGSIGEETAIDALRRGADDYVLKDRPARLGQAVQHALEDNRMRQDRKRLEEILVKERQELKLIIDTSPIIIFYKDKGGRFIRVNKVFAEALRMPAEDFVGKTNFDLYPPEIAQGMTDDDREVIQSGHAKFNIVEQYVSASGVRWVQTDKIPIFDENGNPVGLIGFAQDITERKRAEDALRENEEKYREVVERANDGIAIIQDGVTQFVNQRVADMWGGRIEEAIGAPFTNFIYPEELPKVAERYKRRMAGKDTPPTYETVLMRKDGSKVFAEVNAGIITYQGKPADLLVIRDITARKRADEHIRMRNMELAALNRIGQALSRLASPSEIVELLYTVVGEVLDNRNLYIALYDEKSQSISFPLYTINGEHRTPFSRPFGNGLTEYVIRSKTPLLIPRNQSAFLKKRGIDPLGAPSTCFMAAPMRAGERVMGAIVIQDYERENAYDANHLELLDTLAAQAAIALENSRLYGAVQRELAERKQAEEALRLRMEQLVAVNQASQAVAASLDLDQVLTEIMLLAGKVVASDYASVVLVDEAGHISRGVENLPGIKSIESRIRGKGFTRWIVRSQQPAVVDEIGEDGIIRPKVGGGAPRTANPNLVVKGIKSLVGLPLMVEDHIVGILYLHSLHPRTFHDQLPLLTTFANQAATAIEKARLYEEVQKELAERKMAEKALQEKEEKYRSIFENVQDVYYETLFDGTVLEVSPSIESISKGQYHREDLIGRSMHEFYADSQIRDAIIAALRKTGRVTDFEVMLKNRDNSLILCSISAKVQFDAQGNPEKIIGSMHDITERKRAEQEIEALSRFPAENPNPILRVEQDGKIIYANLASEALLRLWNCTVGEYLPSDWRKRVVNAARNSARTTVEVEWEERAYSIMVVPIPDSGYVNIYGRDITERKLADETLQKSEKRFRALVEHSMEEISLVDPDGTLTYESPTSHRPLGYPPNSIVGHNLFDLFHPDERAAATRLLKQVAKHPGSVKNALFRLRHQDGSWRWMEGFLTNLLDEPAVQSVVINYRDVTERKQAEAELQVSREAERNFAERLTILSEVTTELSKVESLDELCRRAVELGRERLDFDRLAIWFLAEDHTTMLGTFGVDAEGRYTDERDQQFPIGPDYPSQPVVQGEVPLLRLTDTPLILKGQNVGQGMHVSAGLWDGKDVIGYLSIDNLLRQRPISDQDCEIIRLYASAVGHLVSLQRAQGEIQASRETERNFVERLTILSEVTTELSKAESLDALCRRAIELGRERLDFDRLSIWFYSEDAAAISGTYGVDTEGRITDERGERYPVSALSFLLPILQNQTPLIRLEDAPLALKGKDVGQGTQVLAGLWDGDATIGYISLDNLLRQRPFSDRDCEIIRLYASAVGHLVSLQRAQGEIHASRETERNFAERLTILSEITTELSRAESLDALCRRVVELGRERLDFDRLAIWFIAEDRTTMLGSFGVDAEGRITDERTDTHPLTPESEFWPVIQGQITVLHLTDLPLYLNQQSVGQGSHVCAGLSDGKIIFGYMSFDNLLRQRPFSDNDCEIIRLYASAVGHLVSLQRAQKEVHASEERFEKSFQSNPIATIINILPEGRMLDVNDTFLRITGYSREEVIGKTGLELGLWADPEDRIRLARALIALEPLRDVEGRLLTKSGESRDILASAETIQIAGQPHGLIMLVDVTERKQAEEALGAERNLLRTLINNLPDAIYTKDPQGRKTMANRADLDNIGRPEAEVLGKTDAEIFSPQIAAPFEADDQRVLQDGQPVLNREERLVNAKGKQIWQLTSKLPLKDAAGQIVGLVGIGRDITERKQVEETLAYERNLLRALIDNAPDYIYVKDTESRNLLANIASARQSGSSTPEDMLGKTDFDYYPQELAARYLADDQEVFRSGQPLLQHEETTIDGAGNIQWISTNKIPLRDSQGKIYGLVGMGRDITERKRAEEELAQQAEELRRSNEELARLYRASGSLISGASLNLQELAQKIVEIVQRDFGQANCSLLVVHKDSNELVRLTAAGPYADQVKYQNLTLDGPGLVPLSIRMNKVVNVGDVHSSPDYVKGWDEAQSEMVIPLKIGNDAIGVLDVQSSEPNAFSRDDERPMTVFAERVALALEHGRLNAQTDARLQQLTALRTVDMAISSSFDLNLTLGILLDQLKEQLGVHATDILVFNATMQTFRFACERGFRTQMLHRTQFKFGAGYAWQAIRERRLINIPDIQAGPDGLQRSPNLSSEQFVAYLGVPLIAKGEIQGILEVFHREPLVLEKERVGFLEMLAGQAAIAINNAELFDRLQISNTDLTMAYDSTLEGWASALELRDKATEGHARRVTEMTMQLARALGVKENELAHVYRGAVLHDIGKMGVPDHIMLKPGPLTEDEWVIMRKHPQYAYDMLSPIMYLRQALDIPYCHHEKWDGTGYPRGLKGEQIPLAARIFSVVDVWDALTSDRPYRQAWTEAKARQYIQEQEGLHFDPQVVRAFLKENFKKA